MPSCVDTARSKFLPCLVDEVLRCTTQNSSSHSLLTDSHRKFTSFQPGRKISVHVTGTHSDCQMTGMWLLMRIPAVAALRDLSPSHLSGREVRSDREAIHSKVAFLLPQPAL